MEAEIKTEAEAPETAGTLTEIVKYMTVADAVKILPLW